MYNPKIYILRLAARLSHLHDSSLIRFLGGVRGRFNVPMAGA